MAQLLESRQIHGEAQVPKQVPDAELDAIVDTVARLPDGGSIDVILSDALEFGRRAAHAAAPTRHARD